jgi:hypothetical protein
MDPTVHHNPVPGPGWVWGIQSHPTTQDMRPCAKQSRKDPLPAGPGFYVNTYLVMLSVYANIWVLLLLALTDSQVRLPARPRMAGRPPALLSLDGASLLAVAQPSTAAFLCLLACWVCVGV